MRLKFKLNIRYVIYFIVCVFLTISACTVVQVNNAQIIGILSTMVLICSGLLGIIKDYRKIKFKEWQIVAAILYIFFIGLYIVFLNNGSLTGVNVLAGFFPLLFIFWTNLKNNNLDNKFIFILTTIGVALATISISLWLLLVIFPVLDYSGDVYISWGDGSLVPTFYNIFYLSQGGTRNCSLFVEGPACNYFYSSILLMNEFFLEKHKYKRVYTIILVIMIATTQTTTGIIVISVFIFYKIYGSESKSIKVLILRFIFISLIVVVVVYVSSVLATKLGERSGLVRVSKIVIEFDAFKKSPIWGFGFGSYTMGSSNTITSLLADGGVILWGLYYTPLIGILFYDILVSKRINYFIIIYTLMFAVSVFQYSMLGVFIAVITWDMFFRRLFEKTYRMKKNNFLMLKEIVTTKRR